MKGARALASGTIILAAVCALPAVSAAQDSGSPSATTTTTTTTTPAPPTPTTPDPPASPAPQQQPADPVKSGESDTGGGQTSPQQASTPTPTTKITDRSASRAHTSSSTRVSMEDFFFSPATVTVHVGDIVTWHNGGKAPHTATADDGSFDTGTVAAGQSASHMFTRAGTFSYICTIHPNMHGTVRVLSAGGSGGGGGSASSSSATGPSEAAAVASPNAAGNKATLPMTGMAVGALALVGLAMLASGFLVRPARRRGTGSGPER